MVLSPVAVPALVPVQGEVVTAGLLNVIWVVVLESTSKVPLALALQRGTPPTVVVPAMVT